IGLPQGPRAAPLHCLAGRGASLDVKPSRTASSDDTARKSGAEKPRPRSTACARPSAALASHTYQATIPSLRVRHDLCWLLSASTAPDQSASPLLLLHTCNPYS